MKSFVDTLQVACPGVKMHHAWANFASTKDYLSIFWHKKYTKYGITLIVSLESMLEIQMRYPERPVNYFLTWRKES
jgi:hypothetical protein